MNSSQKKLFFFFFFFENENYNFIITKISQDQQRVHHIGVMEYPPLTPTNLLTCLAYLVRLWTTLLPLLRIWEAAIHLLVTRADLADSRRWSYVDREASVLRRVFITTSESPLGINSVIPSSCAKVIALAATMASTMTGENSNGACSDSEVMALP